jgi:hypothetical protein
MSPRSYNLLIKMFVMKSIAYTALVAVVRADNTAAAAAGSGLKCVVPESGWSELYEVNLNTDEECYAYAKEAVEMTMMMGSERDYCYMATEVPGEPLKCEATWAETSAENDDIRAEATDAEDPNTYHAW